LKERSLREGIEGGNRERKIEGGKIEGEKIELGKIERGKIEGGKIEKEE
jgi:hypothetical protein